MKIGLNGENDGIGGGKGGRGLGRKLEEKHWKEGIGDIGLGLLQIQSGFIHSILFSPTHHPNPIPYGQHPYSPPQIQSNRVIWHIFDAFWGCFFGRNISRWEREGWTTIFERNGCKKGRIVFMRIEWTFLTFIGGIGG